jgi:hypothetical protein
LVIAHGVSSFNEVLVTVMRLLWVIVGQPRRAAQRIRGAVSRSGGFLSPSRLSELNWPDGKRLAPTTPPDVLALREKNVYPWFGKAGNGSLNRETSCRQLRPVRLRRWPVFTNAPWLTWRLGVKNVSL